MAAVDSTSPSKCMAGVVRCGGARCRVESRGISIYGQTQLAGHFGRWFPWAPSPSAPPHTPNTHFFSSHVLPVPNN